MRLPPGQFPSRYCWVGAAGTLALLAFLVSVSPRQTVSPAQHERVGSHRSGGLPDQVATGQAASRASALGLRELAPALVSRKLASAQTPTASSRTGNLSPARPQAGAVQSGGQPPHSKALRAEPSATTTSRVANPKSQIPNPKFVQTYGKLPLSFEANQGQTDSRVKFLSRGHA